MKKLNLLIVVMSSVLCIAGCKKDNESSDNKSELIVGKNWELTAFTIDGTDQFDAFYQPCEKDNIQTYTADGKYKVDEGATTCNVGDPQTNLTGSWEIKGDKLTISDDVYSLQIQTTILELNDKTLKYSVVIPPITAGGVENPAQTEIYTYTAQ